MEKKVYKLQIDPELRDYIPPLSETEYQLLTEQILAEGCIDELIVWNGVIVDGHNRYRICHEYNIPFAFKEMEFESKEQAMLWMATKQLGRRNLMPYQKCELVFPLEKIISEDAEIRRRQKISETLKASRTGQISAPSSKVPKTRDIAANMAGVSHDTYERAKVISREADEETKRKLRKGKAFIGTVYRSLVKNGVDEEEKPPVVAAYLDHSIPFEPVQQDTPQVKEAGELPKPLTRLDEPIEVPSMRDAPEKTPYPFPYVKDQVRFAVKNLMKELEIAMNWLRDEDKNNVNELLQILDEGFDQAESYIKEAIA